MQEVNTLGESKLDSLNSLDFNKLFITQANQFVRKCDI